MSYQHNQKTNGPGPIPNRWLYCPRKSEQIVAEHFLAFKTPLSTAYNDQMPIECLFTPDMIFGYCQTLKLKLGLWIDLTNTKRFYDRKCVEDRGAQYVKLQCRGHGETPSVEQTRSFIEIVDNFINDRPFDIIGVHCTHGFNRTGFLICSYLVERMDCSVSAALGMFAKARPPGIYKQDYINELFRRYDDDDVMQAPELPNWCLEYDDSDGNGAAQKRGYSDTDAGNDYDESIENAVIDDGVEGTAVATSSTNGKGTGGPRKKRRREMIIKDAKFMDGVPGVHLVTEIETVSELQQLVQKMCGWEKNGFPGAQPVSMDRQNIQRLAEEPYMVSWKADGTRYMMLIKDRHEIYFFDRNFSCFQVDNLTFLKDGKLNIHHTNTLIDGEMVLDIWNGQRIPRYLIYDIVQIGDQEIGKEYFQSRLSCIKHKLIEPRVEGMKNGYIDRPSEPFSVRCKDFWDIKQAASLLSEKFAKQLLHEPDGLIFQPVKQPYTPGTCPDVFKWKPIELNSVDFRLKIMVETGLGKLPEKIGKLYVGGMEHEYSRIKITRAIKDLNNKIIECTVSNQGEWKFLRERTDKTMPNSWTTADSVMESIRNPVTQPILLSFIDRYGYRPEHESMPPPSSKVVQRSHQQHQTHPQHNNQHQGYPLPQQSMTQQHPPSHQNYPNQQPMPQQLQRNAQHQLPTQSRQPQQYGQN